MTQPYKVVRQIHGKEAFLRTIAAELRFHDGYRYLDRCGFFLNWVTRNSPDWVVPNQPTPQGTAVLNLRTGVSIALSSNNAAIALDRTEDLEEITPEDIEHYIQEADKILNKIILEFEVSKFARLGFRQQFWFPADSIDDTEQWILGLGLVVKKTPLHVNFEAEPYATGLSFVMLGQECRYRVGINGHERAASIPVSNTLVNIQQSTAGEHRRKLLEEMQKTRSRVKGAKFFAEVDIDAYLLDPEQVEIRGFLSSHSQQDLELFRKAVASDHDVPR